MLQVKNLSKIFTIHGLGGKFFAHAHDEVAHFQTHGFASFRHP